MKNFQEQLNNFSDKVLSNSLPEDDKTNYTETLFESIKYINKYGQEFWYARELQKTLGYSQWRRFNDVIERAKVACAESKNVETDHFADVGKMVNIGSSATRKIEDIKLSRYACYLIVMNGDPRKEIIAVGQTYFAVKTRQQELVEDYQQLTDDQKRLAIRNEMKEHNKLLVAAAKDAGVESPLDYAIFQNHGYMGLYGGLKAKDIHARKALKKNQNILDHMGHEELAANLFRATQAEAKLRREDIKGKDNANKAHYDVGSEVRDTIKRLGGTMPEELPTPDESIQQLKKKTNQLEKL